MRADNLREALAGLRGRVLAPSDSSPRPILLGGLPFSRESSTRLAGFVMSAITVRSDNRASTVSVAGIVRTEADLDQFYDLIDAVDEIVMSAGEFGASPQPIDVQDVPGMAEWESMVTAAVADIHHGLLSKVVLARRQELRFGTDVDSTPIIDFLRREYADTAVFAVAAEHESFVGASPERLVEVNDGHVRVDCLAGSAARGATQGEDVELAAWLARDGKNLREHAAVVASITETLQPIVKCLKVSPSPLVRSVRNVHHLSTNVDGDLTDPGVGALDVALALNPTSAMAGTPRDAAMDFIQRHEGFDRGLYAGGIGWVDLAGNGELAVGIRSAHLCGAQATLYAGCGIVDGSDPHSEWLETEVKLLPMRSALGLS
jgi:menaquinone-specific isochorismate synthase